MRNFKQQEPEQCPEDLQTRQRLEIALPDWYWEGECGTLNSISPYSAPEDLQTRQRLEIALPDWYWEGECGTLNKKGERI